MNILIFDFGVYTLQDILESLNKTGIKHRLLTFHFDDKNEDEFFYIC